MRIVTTSVLAVLLSGWGATTGNAIAPLSCDLDKDGYIGGNEAKGCTEQRFEQISAGQQSFGPEQFSKALPNVQNANDLFKQADQNGDGQISREEWSTWEEQGFAAATAKSGSMMPVADYQDMKWIEPWARPAAAAGKNTQ